MHNLKDPCILRLNNDTLCPVHSTQANLLNPLIVKRERGNWGEIKVKAARTTDT